MPQADFDVFNALDILDNASVFKELKFGPGDGNLQYYVYNWRCPQIVPEQVGIVMM
jgi:glycylpeptide N-tetradecanoyltransferase